MKTAVMTWLWVGLWSFAAGCDTNLTVKTQELAAPEEEQDTPSPTKLSNQGECLDPDLSRIPSDVSLTLCSGELAQGQLPVCSQDGGTHCITNETFVATDKTKIDPSKIASGMYVAGIMGTMLPPPADCAADGAVGCVTTNDFKAAAMANVLAGNVKSGVTIAGVTGSANLELHNNCSSDGETGCVATPSYAAADMSRVTAANIRSGIIIAGQMGTYPSAATPLAGASATTDLQSLAATTAAGTYEFFDSTGVRYTGAINDAGTVVPGAADQTFNSSLYRGFTVSGDADLLGNNIKTGVNLFGVAGTISPTPADCSSNAEVGCVTTATFKAADLSNLSAANIKKNVVLAGVTGNYPSSTYPLAGDTATTDLPAFASTTGASTYEWFQADGTRLSGAIEADSNVTPGTAGQTLDAGLYRSVTVAGDADLVAGNIKNAVSIFGVIGNVVPSAADCSSNGEVGCVTTSTYKAADLTNLVSGNIKVGITVAGVAGTYPSLSTPLAGASGTADLTSMDAATPAGNYEFFDSIGTRYTGAIADAGTITAGTSNVAYNTSLYRQFTVAGDADLVASNIKSGVNVLGVAGTLAPAPADCASNAEVGCVTTATFKAADLSNLSAANIKKNVVVAGVTGDYPSATNRLAGADATTDLPLFASTSGGASYEWFTSDGTRITDSVEANETVTASTADQTFNAGLYRSVTVSGDADLVASNIKNAVNLFGVAGNVVPSAADCAANGEVGCVTTPTFKAADLTNLVSGNIKVGVTVAGVAGTYPSLSTPLAGASGTADLTSMDAATPAGSYEFFDSTGTRYTGAIADAGTITAGTSNVAYNTSLYRQFTVAGDADLVASNIKSGVNVLGVAGTLAPAPADCASNAEVGCVTTGTFKAADLSNLTAANIKKNVVVAGVTGDYPSATNRLAGADATTDLPLFASTSGGASYEWFTSDGTRITDSVEANETVTASTADQTFNAGLYRSVTVSGDADLVAGNIKNAVSIFGVTGNVVPSAANCSSDGEVGCVTTPSYKAANMTNVIASNIKDTVVIAGVTGNLSGAPANCSSNGEVGCVTTSTYKATDLTNLISGNIKNGVTIAGTAGTYPSLATPLAGATGTSDLTSMAANTPAGNYEFFDSVGTRYTGSISDAATVTAGTADQSFSTSLYRQFTVAGDADLVAANIKSGVNILGVAGTVTPSPATCSANGVVGCVTTATYKSADLTNLTAANVKSGVVLAGVTGDYPSATNRLAGADATTDLPAFASTTGGSTYEWFSSDGSRLTGSIQADQTLTPSATNQTLNTGLYRSVTVNGDADLVAGNIKTGVNIFGVAGTVTPAPADCSANGTVGCVTTATYKSADLTNLNAGNIKNGVTIAGTAGTYPSAGTPLAGASATTDLTSMAATTAAGSYEFFDSAGARYTGTITDAGTVTSGASNVSFTASLYRQFTVAGDADLVATNIKSGVNVLGVAGSVTPSPANCSANAEVGCVTTATFKAADLSNLSAANVKSGVVLAGVTGDYPSATNRLAGADATTDLPAFASTTGGTTYEWFSSDGSRLTGTIQANQTLTPSASNQTINTGLYRSVTVNGDADLVAGNIKSGTDIFGVVGTVTPAPANCSANGTVGCVTTATYKSADLTNLNAGNVKNGVTIAGTAGTYPSLATPLAGASGTSDLTSMAANTPAGSYEFFDSTGTRYTGTITDAGTVTAGTSDQSFTTSLYRQFTVAGDADLAAGNIKTGINILGVGGTVTPAPANCSADNQTGCVTTATYKSADTGAFVASDLKSGKTVAGVAGTLANCSTDGGVGCVTTASYKAANMTNVTAANIKAGVTIAGLLGDFPSATNRLVGADVTTDLPAFASTTGGSTYEWFQSDGTRLTGAIQANATVTPSTANQTLNTGLYRQVTVNGDANLVAGKIKNGVTLFGVAGDYPSATNPLTGADATADLTTATFDAQIKSATAFEYFDGAGTRYTGAGDADITAANLTSGTTIFGTTGTAVKNNCTSDGQQNCIATGNYTAANTFVTLEWYIRKGKTIAGMAGRVKMHKNQHDTSTYENSAYGNAGFPDFLDTIDDYNNGGAYPSQGPSTTFWTNEKSTGENWFMNVAADNGSGGGVAGDGLCNGSEGCVFSDRITGILWSNDRGVMTWANALAHCNALDYGGFPSSWRVPTQKELMQGYINGVWALKGTDKLSLSNNYYWSSTTRSDNTATAWMGYLSNGFMVGGTKTDSFRTICVRQ